MRSPAHSPQLQRGRQHGGQRYAPQNLSMLRKIALNIIRADKTDTRKSSLRLKRKGAAWDDGVRERMLGSIDMLGECGGPG